MLNKLIEKIGRLNNERRISRRRKFRQNYWRIRYTKRTSNHPFNIPLTKEQTAEFKGFWKFVTDVYELDSMYCQFYTNATGIFDPRYMSDDFYYTVIDTYYNNWTRAKYFDNKTLYPAIFKDIPQPEIIALRRNGFWSLNGNRIISEAELIENLRNHAEYFIKEGEDSDGGFGVTFIQDKDADASMLSNLFAKIKCDIVIQKGVKQSAKLAKLHASSVNTIRIMTFLRNDGSVKICSIVLRMGRNGSKVDNACSGGIVAGVDETGRLKPYAYSANGIRFDEHPTTHVKFDSCVIPNFEKLKALVEQGAKNLPHFRLISWDWAINENDNPVLIEANLKYGELDFHQLNNGPIFGDETQDIVSEAIKNGLPPVLI